MTQPIWYDSTEAGAPTLNNAAGSLLEVLRACLVNGFGAKTVTSISVSGGVATVTCAAHGFTASYGKLLLISGASEALLNGHKQPSDITTNSFTYPAPGVADGTYTGSISARRAPLGWTEAHTGTNVAMFARTSPQANSMLLRVDDTPGNVARVIQVETASSVSTYTGPSPTDAQFAGGGYWQKHNSAASNAWFVVGDGRGFWIGTRTTVSPAEYVFYFFGDGKPYYPGDAFFSTLTFQSTTFWTNSPTFPMATAASYATNPAGSTGVYCARGVGVTSLSSEISAVGGPNTGGQAFGGSGLQASTEPHTAMVGSLHVIGQGKVVRGEMPGLYVPLADRAFTSLSTVIGADGYVYLPVRFNSAGAGNGQVCIQLTGPWY